MDGNRRWAKERGRSPQTGHTAGYEKLLKVLEWVVEFEIPYLTVFAFSTENWKRPIDEIKHIENLVQKVNDEQIERIKKEGVRVIFIGEHEKFSEKTQEKIKNAEERTKDCQKLSLTIALSYGGRRELVLAADSWSRSGMNSTEENFGEFLQTSHVPDPDIVIRTGKEKRISNFLLWKIAYSELFFSDSYWPDFSKEELIEIIRSFKERKRRCGK